MNNLISICIPTYQRPQLLKQAIQSCLIQQYRPIEIIVGDDSKDNITENIIKQIPLSINIKLRYVRNVPSLGQAGNVNKLFEMAEGDRLVLLHDDDLLLPDAIVNLAKCWDIIPYLTAAYGKQHLITMEGEILEQQSEGLNKSYYRTLDYEGVQNFALVAGLTQQFPNDGYMVRSSFAKQIKWRNKEEVGDACDFDFGLRLSAIADKFYFLNQYTAKYRLTDISVSKNSELTLYKYLIVNSFEFPENLETLRKETLKKLAPVATSYYLRRSKRKEALKVYLSEHYPFLQRFTPKGIYHILSIFISILFP